MHDTGCPPFREVLSYLFAMVFSFAMIGYTLLWISTWKPNIVPLNAIIYFLAFSAIIVYCGAMLIRGLFPERWRGKPKSSVIAKVLEIDELET